MKRQPYYTWCSDHKDFKIFICRTKVIEIIDAEFEKEYDRKVISVLMSLKKEIMKI
jgi:hypothetical protein